MSTPITATTSADVFGTVAVAMVTPFAHDGGVDVDAAARLARKLVDDGCDCLVLGGTTGESPTTSDAEKTQLIRVVREAVGDDISLVAGAGSYDTAHSVELARACAQAGADGLLVVTPYYSKPSQEGIYQHFVAVADATDLPVCLYDIPPRSVVEIAPDTIRRLAEHPRIVALKDAKGNLAQAATLIQDTGLVWYSGDDPLNIAWLSVGATGFISVVGHVAAARLRQIHTAATRGDYATAREINATLFPLFEAQAAFGGVSFAKASLELVGLPVGKPRLPQVPVTGPDADKLSDYLTQSGVLSI